jgi:hypothetical protein
MSHILTTDRAALCHFSRLNSDEVHLHAGANKLTRWLAFSLFLVISICLPAVLCGCLGGKIISPASSTGFLRVTPTSINFGGVPVGKTANLTLSLVNQGSATVSVQQMTVAGQAFSVSGEGDLPVSVAAGATYSLSANFSPIALGATSGQLTITSNATGSGPLLIALSGTGAAAGPGSSIGLSSLTCSNGSITGAGTDACTVALNEAAASGGFTVSLTSSNTAVIVPASVTVAQGTTSAGFVATVSPVTTAQTATLTASADQTSGTFTLQLNAAGTYSVNLTWDAPSNSPDPVTGYNVYRLLSGSSSYQQLNASVVTKIAYSDTEVQGGQTYDYIVESVDAGGVTSTPSNTVSVDVP